MKTVIVGIDQSYKNTGITFVCDGEIKNISSIKLSSFENNSQRRRYLSSVLSSKLKKLSNNYKIIVIIERVRLRSEGFISMPYITNISALNLLIVDICEELDIQVYSVDTRSWKSRIIGTSKPMKNKFNQDEKKWPTIKFVIDLGFEEKILEEVFSKAKKKEVFERNGKRWTYNDDAADSVGIALFGYKSLTSQTFKKLLILEK